MKARGLYLPLVRPQPPMPIPTTLAASSEGCECIAGKCQARSAQTCVNWLKRNDAKQRV